MAYFELASIARSQGELKLFEQHREKVLQNLERLPERQKLRVQAAELRAETKWEEAAELLENLIANSRMKRMRTLALVAFTND